MAKLKIGHDEFHAVEEYVVELERPVKPRSCNFCGADAKPWQMTTEYKHMPEGKNKLSFECFTCDPCYEALING